MKLIYFAWIREKTGIAEETVTLPAGVDDVGGLLDWLGARGGGFAEAVADRGAVRVAVNQEYVTIDHAVGTDDEVALFPPMTGGRGG